MLSDRRLGEIVNETLTASLGPHGFVRADVTGGEDDLGDPALFVKAHFAAGSRIVPGDELSVALAGFRARLRDAGETRFPYFGVEYARARA